MLCYFATYLAKQELSSQTIKTYISAARNLHISLGFPDPRDSSSLPMLQHVQAGGIKRVQALKQSQTRRVRLPITLLILDLLRQHWEASKHPNRFTLWAAASLCFAGFFRSGELLETPGSQGCPTTMQVHLSFSKCDQFGKGVDIYIGSTDNPLCPVTAVMAFMMVRGTTPGRFFITQDEKPLTKSQFVAELRKALAACGFNPIAYAGHNFRIGAATAEAQAELPDSTIQTLGRWNSAAFLSYIRTPRQQLASLTKSIIPSNAITGATNRSTSIHQ